MKMITRSVLAAMALAALVLALPAAPLRAGEPVKHRFLVVDNAANRLILVDQNDPNAGWSVAIPSPNSRDLQLVGAGRVLVSHPNGAAEYELAAGRKVWETTTYNGVNTARRLLGGNTLLGANAKEGIVVHEVTREGKEVSKRVLDKQSGALRVMRWLAGGNLLLNLAGPCRAVEMGLDHTESRGNTHSD
jgi:hypothetical protein